MSSEAPSTIQGGSPMASPTPSNPPQQLTPRSKVQALLARFDDSDSDSSPMPIVQPQTAPSLKDLSSSRDSHSSNVSDASNSESDSEPRTRKPIGKIAARMRGILDQSKQSRSPPKLLSSQPSTPAKLNNSTSPKDQAIKSIFGGDPQDASAEKLQANNSPESHTPSPSTSKSAASLPHPSPGLFVSPTNAHSPAQQPMSRSSSVSSDSDDSDIMLNTANQRLKELVSRKKSEKKAAKRARRQEEKERAARRAEKIASDAADLERIVGSESDGEGEPEIRKALTQQSRPMRKAGKKAMEEMNRETQRLSREQHLAHQAKVKKAFRTSDFLKYFNAKRGVSDTVNQTKTSDDEWKMSGALVSSDTEQHPSKDTPPTSPIAGGDAAVFKPPPGVSGPSARLELDDDEELPTIEELRSQPIQQKVDAEQNDTVSDVIVGIVKIEPVQIAKKTPSKIKKVRVILPLPNRTAFDDSDDDLEILDVKPAAAAILENVPISKARESNSLRALRNLANLTSPGRNKPKAKGKLTMTELHFKLQAKARQQALQHREERINEARARGIYIPTAEERERDQAELISIEKARADVMLLTKKEKEQRQKDGNDADDGLDDSEDEEFEYEGETDSVNSETEVNADEADDEEEEEEEEGEEEDLLEDEDNDLNDTNPFFDEEAEVDEGEEEDNDHQVEISQASRSLESPSGSAREIESTKRPVPRRAKNRKVVSDDEDEENEVDAATQDTSSKEVLGAFGFGQRLNADIGLSQAFAGTLAEADSQALLQDSEEDSLALLRQLPPGTIPEFDNALFNEKYVPYSQREGIVEGAYLESVPSIHLGLSQFSTQLLDKSPSKMSDIPQLTQDVGFAAPREPAGIRVPQSTVDTVPLHTQDTSVIKKRGKLRRKASVAVLSESEGENLEYSDQEQDGSDVERTRDAFDVLFKNAKRRKKVEEFDKKQSAAKGLVEEQAEESEDEYRGLGGASDDESAGEMDEEIAQMIDEGPVKVDERQIAAFHAEKERKEDEKKLEKLYKDVTTGLLRKKRGGNLDDLDDSDDEIMERRRRKQEEFARMRRALLADEKIGEIAQNPKQQAFFRTIEDNDDMDGINYLDDEEPYAIHESQVENDQEAVGDHAIEMQAPSLKRKASDVAVTSSGKENVPPEDSRQSSDSFKRPRLTDIREQLSFLTEDSIIPDSQPWLSDDEGDEEEHRMTITRTNTTTSTDSNGSKSSVVNRLLRTQLNEDASTRPLAFQAADGKSGPGFKIPSLLRRATNLSTTSESSSTSTSNSNEKSVRLGGSKKSNIHYQAYEAERRRIVEAADQKRKAQLKKTVRSTKGRSIMGLLHNNSNGFES